MSKGPKRPVALVAAADDKFAGHLTVCLHSALSRLERGREAEVFILDGGIAPDRLDRCRSILIRAYPGVRVHVVPASADRFASLCAGSRFTPATFLRLLAPQLLPHRLERILYLDCDTVTTEDIAPLFDMDAEGRALWAVSEGPPEIALAFSAQLHADFAAEGFPRSAGYFNSGVLLMSLPEWRARRISERALALLEAAGHKMRWLDQDALNVALADDWGRLPLKWNNLISGHRVRQVPVWRAGAGLGILHFASSMKPWRPGRCCIAKERYLLALLRSGWLPQRESRRVVIELAETATIETAKRWMRRLRGLPAHPPLVPIAAR